MRNRGFVDPFLSHPPEQSDKVRGIFFLTAVLLWLAPVSALSGQVGAAGDEFVRIPGGCFDQGCAGEGPACGEDERPRHRVCTDDFFLGRTEVTVAAYRVFIEASGYRTDAERLGGCFFWTGIRWEKRERGSWRSPGFPQTDQDPVVCVSWRDAVAYIGWRNGRDGENLRLPREVEWEFAASQRGEDRLYPWSGGPVGNLANRSIREHFQAWPWPTFPGYEDGFVFSSPVRHFSPDELGLFGIGDNVEEWTQDPYRPYGQRSPSRSPAGDNRLSGEERSIRGGCWLSSPWFARVADRKHGYPWARGVHLGFRLARSP